MPQLWRPRQQVRNPRGQNRNGLVGRWAASGNGYEDISGYGRYATLTACPFVPAAVLGGMLSFDGSSSFGTIPSPLNGWTELTVSTWFKTSATQAAFCRLVEQGANSEWVMSWNQASSQKVSWEIQNAGAGFGRVTSINTLNDGNLHQAVGTISKSGSVYTTALWVDAVLQQTTTTSTGPSGTNSAVTLGRYGGGGFFYSGLQGDCRIYNRALTPAEIDTLYRSKLSAFTLPPDEWDVPVLYNPAKPWLYTRTAPPIGMGLY